MAGYALIVGGANLDLLGATAGALAMGDSNPGRIRASPGGVARNVAENLARLGVVAHLLSAVGNDAFGASVLAATAQAGVHVDQCWQLPLAATSTYLSLHGPNGDMVVAINDMGILDSITPALLSRQAVLFSKASVIVVDCNLSTQALGWICSKFANKPIVVDAVSAHKCGRIQSWLGSVHTLKLNQLEAGTLSGLACEDTADVEAIAHWLHTKGVHHVAISLGAKGVYWSAQNSGSGWQAPLACKVVNTTGAGDALTAGLVYGLLQAYALERSVAFAQGCAAVTVGCAAANHPNLSVALVTELVTQSTVLL